MHDIDYLNRDPSVLSTSVVSFSDGDIGQSGTTLGTAESSHSFNATSTPIDRLPHELLLAVFKLYADVEAPVQDLVRLTLVCKLWRNIVEGSPNLWCRISGHEKFRSIRKALAMANDVPLEFAYWGFAPKADQKIFFALIKDRIAQVKSLNVHCTIIGRLVAILHTTTAPKLETLHLKIHQARDWRRGAVTLFRGQPAAPTLKDFCVSYIPIVLGPLRLSGLRSLELSGAPIVSAEELLRILMESPALEDCLLQSLVFPTEFPPSEQQRQIGSRSRAIQLLHLRHLSLLRLPVSFTHFILSNTQASSLSSFSVECELRRSPASELFTANTSHLAPALKGLGATDEEINIIVSGEEWSLYVGKFSIGIQGLPVEPKQVKETLDWAFTHLGTHLKARPTSLIIRELGVRADFILWVSSNLNVTYLELWTSPEQTVPCNIISLLSRPVVSMPNQWALPNLESIDVNILDEADKLEILEMVEARHSFIQAQEDHGRSDTTLKQFKEIRLSDGRDEVGTEQLSKEQLLIAIEKVGRGAEIWWEGVKWVGNVTVAQEE